jgi:hypothetical protein
MKRNYEEMKSNVEKVMQEGIDSIKIDINFFQKGLTKFDKEKLNEVNSLLLKEMFTWLQNISIRNMVKIYLII